MGDSTLDDKKIRPRLEQRAERVEPIDQELLKFYIVYARKHVHPTISGVDFDKIANFYKDLRAEAFRSGGAPTTARFVDSLMRIAEANARMELRQHVTNKDVDNAIAAMLESFIQSQKHQVAEELRNKFKRYIVQAVPTFEQVVSLLERLFREKMKQIRTERGEAPELSEVSVEMAELANQIQENGIDMMEASSFMSSQRFQRSYLLVGEQIHRA